MLRPLRITKSSSTCLRGDERALVAITFPEGRNCFYDQKATLLAISVAWLEYCKTIRMCSLGNYCRERGGSCILHTLHACLCQR